MRSSATGASGWSEDTGGGSVWSTAPITVAAVVPFEGPPPVAISWTIAAKCEDVAARIGLAARELLGRHVRKRAEHGARGGQRRSAGRHGRQCDADPAVDCSFESPKSSSFAPDLVSITLPGFRSRWTSPRRCA